MKPINVTRPAAFDGLDLARCQVVFDALIQEAGATKDTEEANRIAGIVVELYRHGIRDPEQLQMMVEGARGLRRSVRAA